jgi:hypothetical protein
MQGHDHLKVAANKNLLRGFVAGESVLWSAEVVKINKNRRKQRRNMVLTNEALYSIRPDNFLTGVQRIFNKDAMIKRKINLANIKGLVYARLGYEFVIHVPDEFDYRIVWKEKDAFIELLLLGLKSCGIKELQFYLTDELELFEFCTHRSEKKKGVIRPPVGETRKMTVDMFEEFLEEKSRNEREEVDNTEVVVGDKVFFLVSELKIRTIRRKLLSKILTY